FVLCALALVAACIRRCRNRTLALPFPESVFVFGLAALPFFGFLLARFVTHSIEVRYVLGAIIGITVLLAVVLEPTLRRNPQFSDPFAAAESRRPRQSQPDALHPGHGPLRSGQLL